MIEIKTFCLLLRNGLIHIDDVYVYTEELVCRDGWTTVLPTDRGCTKSKYGLSLSVIVNLQIFMILSREKFLLLTFSEQNTVNYDKNVTPFRFLCHHDGVFAVYGHVQEENRGWA